MIPEARQIEVAVVGGEVGRKGDSQVEIDALLRLQRDGEPTEVALPRLLLGDDDGQRLVGGEQASVGGAGEFQVVADGSVSRLFQTESVVHVRGLQLSGEGSEAARAHNGFQNRFHISLFVFIVQLTVGAAPRVCPTKEESLREKFIKNLIQNLSKIINEKFMFNS